MLLAMVRRFDEAPEADGEAGPLLDDAGVESLSWGSLGSGAYAKLLMGDREGAKRYLEAKWRVYPVEDGKTQRLAIGAAYNLANLLCDEARWDEAEAILAQYGDARPTGGTRLIVEARVTAARNRTDEALAMARRAVEQVEKTDLLNHRAGHWLALPEVQRKAGLQTGAESSTAGAIRLYEQKGNIAAIELMRAGTATAVVW